ncbi:hypothetical protein Lal_00020143 [Lupinus albus]|nr:hypothetical protein Lal_00020143 [Lupinus albus]
MKKGNQNLLTNSIKAWFRASFSNEAPSMAAESNGTEAEQKLMPFHCGCLQTPSSQPSTPSSSGYVAEIEDLPLHNEIQDLSIHSDHHQFHNEDDASISWRKRKKHFFVLSHSGKPIYSRYGDEHKLAGFSATLQAIISFVENGGDRVKLVRAGKHQVCFLS